MNFSNKQFFAWLLVLMMIINPAQGMMKFSLDQSTHSNNCDSTMEHSANQGGMDSSHDCSIEHSDDCLKHVQCLSHVSSSMFVDNSALEFIRKTTLLSKFSYQDDTVLFFSPELLKRPPKA